MFLCVLVSMSNLLWGETQTCEYELRWQWIGRDNLSLWVSGLFARNRRQNGFGQGEVDWLWVWRGRCWYRRLWRLKAGPATEGSGSISGSYSGRGGVCYYRRRWDVWGGLRDCRNTSWWERRSWWWQERWDGGGHLLCVKRHVLLVGRASSITIVLVGDCEMAGHWSRRDEAVVQWQRGKLWGERHGWQQGILANNRYQYQHNAYSFLCISVFEKNKY